MKTSERERAGRELLSVRLRRRGQWKDVAISDGSGGYCRREVPAGASISGYSVNVVSGRRRCVRSLARGERTRWTGARRDGRDITTIRYGPIANDRFSTPDGSPGGKREKPREDVVALLRCNRDATMSSVFVFGPANGLIENKRPVGPTPDDVSTEQR